MNPYAPEDPNAMNFPSTGAPVPDASMGMSPMQQAPAQPVPMPMTLAPVAPPPQAPAPVVQIPTQEIRSYSDPRNMREAKQTMRSEYQTQRTTADEMKDSMLKAGDMEAKKQADLAEAETQIARQKAGDALEEQSKQEHFLDIMTKKQAEIDKDQDDLKSMKVDPNRYYSNMGTGQRISAMIAAIGSGFQGGYNGTGRNVFMESMERDMDRDIASQESAIANKKSSIAAKQSALGAYLNQGMTMAEARQNLKANMYGAAKQQAMAQADSAQSQITKQQAMQAVQIFDQKESEARMAHAKEAYLDGQRQAAAAAAAQRAAADKQFDRAVKMREFGNKDRELDIKEKEAVTKSPPGTSLPERTEKYGEALAQKKIPEAISSIQDVKRRNPELMSGEGGIEGVSGYNLQRVLPNAIASDKATTNRRDIEQLALAYRNQVTGTGGSDAEAARIQEAFIGAKTPAEIKHAIDKAQSIIDENMKTFAGAYGPDAVTEYQKRRAAGPVSPSNEQIGKPPPVNVVGKK